MEAYHQIEDLRIDQAFLRIRIDGAEHEFAMAAISEKLARAGAEERARCEVSPSGYRLHWPLLDEDLSIGGLLWSHRALMRQPSTDPEHT